MSTQLLPPTDSQVASMRQAILTAIPQRQRRRRTRNGLTGALAAIVIAGASTAGAIAYHTSIQALNSSFDCYTTANVNDPHGTSRYPDDPRYAKSVNTMLERVQFALQTCEAGYAAVPTSKSPGAGPFDVPHPTACLLDDGRVAVLPNKDALSAADFCRSVALRAPQY